MDTKYNTREAAGVSFKAAVVTVITVASALAMLGCALGKNTERSAAKTAAERSAVLKAKFSAGETAAVPYELDSIRQYLESKGIICAIGIGESSNEFTARDISVTDARIGIARITGIETLTGFTTHRNIVTLNKADGIYTAYTLFAPEDLTVKSDSAVIQGYYEVDVDLDEMDFEMVYVKGGTFTMGCTPEQGDDCFDNERPAHQVTVSDFYIGKYEVTFRQWLTVTSGAWGASGYDVPHDAALWTQLPVDNVSWYDVQKFITELNKKTWKQYRLPTEAEWEYAACGGNQSKGFKYAGSNNIDEAAWYYGNSGNERLDDKNWGGNHHNSNVSKNKNRTHPVGAKLPNELGVYDMSGNISEWVQDRYRTYTGEAKTNPAGPLLGTESRVVRGSNWNFPAKFNRVSNRSGILPSNNNKYIGFRLAHPVPPRDQPVETTRYPLLRSPAGEWLAPPTASTGPTATEASTTDSFTDERDGRTYRTVKIGKRTWMAENLNHQTTTGSRCYYNDESYCDKYGRLYTWDTAMTACPAGWRLPAKADWEDLIAAAGGRETAAKKLKATAGWRIRRSANTMLMDGNGTDELGFSALPGGRYNAGRFDTVGSGGYWWGAYVYNDGRGNRSGTGNVRNIMWQYDKMYEIYYRTDWFELSVRCVRI